MSPALAASIDVARSLAWFPWSNAGGRSTWYRERREMHSELVRRLSNLRSVSLEARPLVRAMRRAASCTYSNRYGLPYIERRAAIRELRAELQAWTDEHT